MRLCVLRCTRCGATVFPARYLCAACGSADWQEVAVEHGTVSEITTVRYRIGAPQPADIYIGGVVTDAGPVVIARLEAPFQSGTEVDLEMDDENRILARGPARTSR